MNEIDIESLFARINELEYNVRQNSYVIAALTQILVKNNIIDIEKLADKISEIAKIC